MKKHLSLLLLNTLFTITCFAQQFSVDTLFDYAYRNGHERSGIYQLDYNGWMSEYLMAYINNYYEQPKDIDFLIKAFDQWDDPEMREVYARQYQLMSEYKNDLKLYCTDSVTALFYKSIQPENIVAITGYVKPVFDEFGRMRFYYLYYDRDGYVVTTEEISLKYKKELHAIVKKYEQQGWKDYGPSQQSFHPEYKMIIVQYTPEQGLIDLDNKKRPLNTQSSAYFSDVEQWLKITCEEHQYSKMIISTLIPKDYDYVFDKPVVTRPNTDNDYSFGNLSDHLDCNFYKTPDIYLIDDGSDMGQYMNDYIDYYCEQPKTIDFLIKAFDKTDILSDRAKERYAQPHKLLKKYKDELMLYCTNSITALFYQRIKPANIVALAFRTKPDFGPPLSSFRSRTMFYYDQEGYLLATVKLSSKFRDELSSIVNKHYKNGWQVLEEGRPDQKYVIVEYTPSKGLINVETQQLLHIEDSPYFCEVQQWLKRTCEENNYSRMIISSPIPRNAIESAVHHFAPVE